MSRRRMNPVSEAAIYALGTATGIVLGTVIATYVVEKMRASGTASNPPPLPVSPLPPSIPTATA